MGFNIGFSRGDEEKRGKFYKWFSIHLIVIFFLCQFFYAFFSLCNIFFTANQIIYHRSFFKFIKKIKKTIRMDLVYNPIVYI
jgi:hypothetical protein